MTKVPLFNQSLSRRGFIRGASLTGAALAASPLLQACGGTSGGSAKSVIDVWTPDTRDPAIESGKWWYDSFTARAGTKVKPLVVPYGEDVTKLRAGHATGAVPDLTWAYGDTLYTHGVDGLAQPVTSVVDAIGRERFIPAALQGIEIDDEVYSIPFVGFPFFVYYRKDLYEKAGLKPPTTHQELMANVRALHNPPEQYGYMVTNKDISDVWNLRTAMWTHGAYFFDEDDNLALDRPETVAAWQYYKDLAGYSAPGSMAQSDVEVRELMIDGKVAHMLTTTSFSSNFTSENIDMFGGYVYPSAAGARGASLDFYGLVIPAKAEDAGEAEALAEFIYEPKNYKAYLEKTVVGWVPMLQDAYTEKYLSSANIAPVRSFIELGQKAALNAVVGTGYFGPSAKASALVATNVEKQIGDRLVIDGESPESVIAWATEIINQEL
jgi:ABC-type glycerol-3-phosphate transport system substrate-binding protein